MRRNLTWKEECQAGKATAIAGRKQQLFFRHNLEIPLRYAGDESFDLFPRDPTIKSTADGKKSVPGKRRHEIRSHLRGFDLAKSAYLVVKRCFGLR
jgi:hypothetical protein